MKSKSSWHVVVICMNVSVGSLQTRFCSHHPNQKGGPGDGRPCVTASAVANVRRIYHINKTTIRKAKHENTTTSSQKAIAARMTTLLPNILNQTSVGLLYQCLFSSQSNRITTRTACGETATVTASARRHAGASTTHRPNAWREGRWSCLPNREHNKHLVNSCCLPAAREVPTCPEKYASTDVCMSNSRTAVCACMRFLCSCVGKELGCRAPYIVSLSHAWTVAKP